MKVAILVVIYDKQLDDSNTLKSLLKVRPDNVFLTVINNGPDLLMSDSECHFQLNEKFKNLELIEYINNKPLGILYNDFIRSMPDADYYILMDDDSIISNEYISVINGLGDEDFDLLLPKIKSIKDNCIYYPVEQGVIIDQDRRLDSVQVFSNGSGMIISKTCVQKILMHFPTVFDERYAFYGVDMSIFRRIRIISKKNKSDMFLIISKATILHSLSRIDSTLSFFRASERLIDATLTFRNYFGIKNAIFFLKVFVKCFSVLGGNKSLAIFIKHLFSGCHERTKKWKSE